ncbi:Threonine/homoserine/homoserine lactone efflux protein [Novosphingobium sp. CF614]|uniref:LysE family translocator n=1 Tax=Novosphingobium sp. CF614 TaxID=1884364 RepID=UPI0008F3FEC7|nr:hypothetical protein [Novosphingobium sp. CF614]SFG05689.1 Threonine/homoserine/homoserine lactone efflux protein [Novosphingobium sp. CF614]
MTLSLFFCSILALLVAPGPTNTLMGLAGAQGGPRRMAWLIPAELLGYLTTIVPLAYLGPATLGRWPVAAIGVKVVAAMWILFLAARLWRMPGQAGHGGEISARKLYLTTVLNPKALIFGLVLLPPVGDAGFAPKLAVFMLTVVAVAMGWNLAGSMTRAGAGHPRRLQAVQRIASLWLATVSVALLGAMLRA